MRSIADELVSAARKLARDVDKLTFAAPVVCVYDPLTYAWAAHEQYLRRFAHAPNDVVLVGMNPGPFGMAQTGVPFGEVAAVRDWMKIEAPIRKPKAEHAKRPVDGLLCKRSEVSGARLWGAIARAYPKADAFFARHFVLNYCPLLFLVDSGANFTPDKLPKHERIPLEAACDAHLARALSALAPHVVVGVGAWATKRVSSVLDRASSSSRALSGVRVTCLPHPSPASPRANAGWEALARQALVDDGVEPFF